MRIKFRIAWYPVEIRIGCKSQRFSKYSEAEAAKTEGYKIIQCAACRGFHLWRIKSLRAHRVMEYQSGKCADCGEKVGMALTVHHIIPRSNGGGDQMSNLIGLCRPCHDLRHSICSAEAKRKAVQRYKQYKRANPDEPDGIIREKMIAAGIIPRA